MMDNVKTAFSFKGDRFGHKEMTFVSDYCIYKDDIQPWELHNALFNLLFFSFYITDNHLSINKRMRAILRTVRNHDISIPRLATADSIYFERKP